ncbi:unnamed protein product [Ixodes pacificus]
MKCLLNREQDKQKWLVSWCFVGSKACLATCSESIPAEL